MFNWSTAWHQQQITYHCTIAEHTSRTSDANRNNNHNNHSWAAVVRCCGLYSRLGLDSRPRRSASKPRWRLQQEAITNLKSTPRIVLPPSEYNGLIYVSAEKLLLQDMDQNLSLVPRATFHPSDNFIKIRSNFSDKSTGQANRGKWIAPKT